MRQALGRGLDALIPGGAPLSPADSDPGAVIRKIPLSSIRPNHLQPRKHFDPEKLSELALSIKEHGLAQPILVSHSAASNSFELIAGERRLRAAELAGLSEIEAVVKNPESDRERLAIALIENIQREDLNPIETGLGYLRLMKEFGMNQTQLTQIVGKSKAAVSNTLRLLDLPEEIQKAVQNGQLSEGHARALLSIEEPMERHKLFRLAVDQRLSVREVEDYARRVQSGQVLPEKSPARPPKPPKPADIKALESALQQKLGTKVEIKTRKDGTRGALTIHFYSLEEFDRLVIMLK